MFRHELARQAVESHGPPRWRSAAARPHPRRSRADRSWRPCRAHPPRRGGRRPAPCRAVRRGGGPSRHPRRVARRGGGVLRDRAGPPRHQGSPRACRSLAAAQLRAVHDQPAVRCDHQRARDLSALGAGRRHRGSVGCARHVCRLRVLQRRAASGRDARRPGRRDRRRSDAGTDVGYGAARTTRGYLAYMQSDHALAAECLDDARSAEDTKTNGTLRLKTELVRTLLDLTSRR